MLATARVMFALLPALLLARVALAGCDPSIEPDRTDVANARAAVAVACDCATAVDHRSYVRCAVATADPVLVNKHCRRAVRRCASKSACGRPGAVACCRTTSAGRTSCRIKQSAAHCVAPAGGSACAGSTPSCCDACGAGSCDTTTSTSTTSTSSTTLFPPQCGVGAGGVCGGFCPSLFDDCVNDPDSGGCQCVPGPCRAIGGIGSCGGTCPSPAVCSFYPGGCTCIAQCPGSCPTACLPGQMCLLNLSTSTCQCAP